MEVYGLKKRFCGILCIVLMGFLLTGCNVEFGFNRKSNVSNNAEGNVNESIGIDGVDKPEDEDFKYLLFPKTGDRLKIDYMGVVIGRSSKTASYVIRGNDLVSRPHCKVYKENGKYYVHDCTSKNGTFVDGVQVMPDKDVEIKSGSILLVANERFVFDK